MLRASAILGSIRMSDYYYLIGHVGHNVVINHYPEEGEVTVECEDCNWILLNTWEDEDEWEDEVA